MRFKLLTTAIALLITQSVLAAPANPPPCPSVDALESVGVSVAAMSSRGEWFGAEWKNDFNTKNEWTFIVGPLRVHGEEDVLKEANSHVSKLVFHYKATRGDEARCFYKDTIGHVAAVAASPAIAPTDDMFKLLRK